jgi:DNA-binding transcriptional MerR regulator
MARLYEVRQVAAILGVSPRRVESWIEYGFIKPHTPSKGTGQRNQFDLANIAQGMLLLELQAIAGEKSPLGSEVLAEVRRISHGIAFGTESKDEELRSLLGQLVADEALFVFYTNGKPTKAKRISASASASRKALVEAMRAGQAVIAISVAAIRRRIRERLEEISD